MSIDNNSNNNNNNNQFEIPLILPKKLEESGIISKFCIDTNDNYVKLRLNSIYDPPVTLDVPIDIIKQKDGWKKFTNEFKDLRKTFKNVSEDHNIWIYSAVNENGSRIRSHLMQNQQQHHQQQQESDQLKEQEQQKRELESTTEEQIPFSERSIKLVEKYSDLQKEILNLIPELWEPVEFTLSVRTILRIKSITLPFAGIVLGTSGGLKTATVELYRNTQDTCYRDSFSAKSFVSHNTAVPKEKLIEIDLLPAIKDKLFLTPELSPTFSKKEDELNEILGIITRVLDGHGYESQSGAQGHRGYTGKHMFVWIGAAVDIPRKVHRLLGTLGPKLYFFRLKKVEKDEKDYLKQMQDEEVKGDYIQKIEKIKSKMNDYLQWFDSRPFDYDTTINNNNKHDIEEKVLLRIIRLAILLKHLRGNVPVYETKESQGSDYGYTSASLEDPNRAITQLRNLARGHALSQGRTVVTMQDIPLLIKVVLSTASKERVILFDHLLENNGKLDTINIKDHLLISKKTALKTMTELVILEIVDRLEMENNNPYNNNNNAFQIQLKDEFSWFLTDEFKKLRQDFGKEYYDEYISSKQESQQQQETEDEDHQEEQEQEGKKEERDDEI
jgi:hypothetical protein